MGGDRSEGDNEPLTEEQATPPRVSLRKRVLWKARIEVDGVVHPCIVVNLSLGGARLHFAEHLKSGTKVKLILDRFGAFSAYVAWHRNGRAGLRFTDDPRRMADVIGARIPLERTKIAANG